MKKLASDGDNITLELDEKKCIVSREALQDHYKVGGQKKDLEQAFDKNYLYIEGKARELITAGEFQSNGTVLIGSAVLSRS